MLAVIACLAGIFAILVIEEILHKHKILQGEYLRKYVHITSGIFIAFWPWLISWRAIQWMGLAMLAVILYNHRSKSLNMGGELGRRTYGGTLFPIVISLCALITNVKIFFALAILHLALADGLAAVIGTAYGKSTQYKVFGQIKSLAGSATFWFTSLCILAIGLLFAHDLVMFDHYVLLVILLPPILAILENLSVFGLDNVVVPVAVILALQLTQIL